MDDTSPRPENRLILHLLLTAHHGENEKARIESGNKLVSLLVDNGMYADLIERSHDAKLPDEVRENAKNSILKAAIISSKGIQGDLPLIHVATCDRVPKTIREEAGFELLKRYNDQNGAVDADGLHKICFDASFPLIVREKAGMALIDFLYVSDEVGKLRRIVESPTETAPYIVRMQACKYFYQSCLDNDDRMSVEFMDFSLLPSGIRIEAEGWIEKIRQKNGMDGETCGSSKSPSNGTGIPKDTGQSQNASTEKCPPDIRSEDPSVMKTQILQVDECWKPATSFSALIRKASARQGHPDGRILEPKPERKLPR